MTRETVIVIKFAPSKTLISPWAILAQTINNVPFFQVPQKIFFDGKSILFKFLQQWILLNYK